MRSLLHFATRVRCGLRKLDQHLANADTWQRRGVTLIFLAVATLPILCGHVRYAGSDAKGVTVVAQQLLADGTVSLKGKQAAFFADGSGGIDRRLFLQNGQLTYYYPIGPVLVALPFVALENLFGVRATDRKADWKLQEKLVFATAGLIIFLLRRVLFPVFGSLASIWLATLFFYGTLLAPTVGGAFWSVDCEVVCTCLVITVVWRVDPPLPRRAAIIVGALLFFGFLCRPTFTTIILPIFGYLALRDRRALVTSSLTSAILLIGFAGFSEINYGSYLPPYYFASRLSADHSLPALVALVFSPSRGVLIFNPFLFAALAFARYAKSVRNPLVLISLATTMLAQFASNVFFPHWTGGESYGPRILANLVLTGCIITISLLEAMPENTRRASTWYLVATLSVGMCVNMPGLISKYTMLWNEFPPIDFDPWIVWDWKFPQFLSYSKSRVRLKCLEQSRTLSRATQQLCQNIQ